jgi:uncharacterized membrane-anchored protein
MRLEAAQAGLKSAEPARAAAVGPVANNKEPAMTAEQDAASKVPEVTLVFWIIKICATTLGETGGDAVSMSMELGYLVSTGIFAVVFAAAVAAQIKARAFHPVLYWVTIVATTTVGTTLADFATRNLFCPGAEHSEHTCGIGYPGGSILLFALLMGSLFAWHRALGSVSIVTVKTPRAEMFYWVTIMFSQTLGTALGDWTADSAGFGYLGAAMIFVALLAVVAAAYFRTRLSHTALFWAAFILTRPLGATLGDFLDKPLDEGGLALSRYTATAVLVLLIGALIAFFPHRPAGTAH